jgi:Cu/Ag efflux protein CusF
MQFRYAIALVAALLVTGCAGAGLHRNRTASEQTLVTATATVQAIDQNTRAVTLRDDADGSTFTVVAGPEVRNLDQVSAGDHVQIDYYRSLAVAMANPSDTGEPLTAAAGARAPEGAMPGAAAVMSTSLVVTLISYDNNTGIATFRTPDGFTRQTAVRPDLRTFAQTLNPGARVLVTMTEAVAVTITEAPAA